MKRHLVLLIAFSVTAVVFTGCGSKPEKADEKKYLKPGDVSPNTTVKLDDLVEGVVAEVNAWKSKEVAVTGFVVGISGSLVTLINDKESKSKISMSCDTPADVPSTMLSNPSGFKGKISRIEISDYNSETRYSVELKPCELQK